MPKTIDFRMALSVYRGSRPRRPLDTMTKLKRVAIYTRVSTDGQSVENQRRELLAVAERRGWEVVLEYSDHGISGAKDRDKRPAFDRMLKGATRREFDMIAAWSVDRLGRSLQHLVAYVWTWRGRWPCPLAATVERRSQSCVHVQVGRRNVDVDASVYAAALNGVSGANDERALDRASEPPAGGPPRRGGFGYGLNASPGEPAAHPRRPW